LADWGAEVVKIEPPDGDPFRGLYLAAAGAEVPANPPFELDNRGKRSIALNLRTEDGRGIANQLIDRADVFVTNVRPEILESFGLDDARLRARNPRLRWALVLAPRPAGPAPLARPAARRRASRLARGSALRNHAITARKLPRAGPPARRDLRHPRARRVGRDLRPRRHVVGARADD